MEIQKIFSEIDTDEKLYSVLMSEDELALFSEIQKEFSLKGVLQKIANTPEAKRIISTARTSSNRLGVKYGQAIKGLTDEALRGYELNTPVYAKSISSLLKRGAKEAGKGLKKTAEEISKDASTARKMNNKTSGATIIRSLNR